MNKSEIILEQWDKGSETNKKRLSRYRLLVETYAYNCMESLEKDLNTKNTENKKEHYNIGLRSSKSKKEN